MWVNFSINQRLRCVFLGLAGTACVVDTLVLLAAFKINTGTLLPGAVGLLLLFPVGLPKLFTRCLQHRLFRLIWRGGWATGLILLAGLPVFVLTASLQQTSLPATQPAAVIILGAGLRAGDQPSPLLARRLDVALDILQRFPDAPVVVSGGHGMLETVSEAEAMQHYLLTRGITRERIWLENQSTSTQENLRFSRQVLDTHDIDVARQPIAIVTSGFHTYRSARLARHAGYARTDLIPAPTPLSILPNVWLREYLACIKAWLTGEIG
jgi:uncharacterized SAM-binding protein YcdF (DUF218 family)